MALTIDPRLVARRPAHRVRLRTRRETGDLRDERLRRHPPHRPRRPRWWTPAWSPDGRRIAFTSERDGNPEIYVMNADGSGVTRLTYNDARDLDSFPAWSPDGRRIAFHSNRDGNFEIYVMNASGEPG